MSTCFVGGHKLGPASPRARFKAMTKVNFFSFSLLFLISFIFSSFLNAGNIVGLKNQGETCYANAVFQLLYHSRDFRNSLDQYLQTNQNSNLQALRDTFRKMDTAAPGSTVIPETFKALPENFLPNTQYDVAQVLNKYQSISGLDWSPFAIKLVKNDPLNNSNILVVEFDLELFLSVPEIDKLCLQDLLALHFSHKKIDSVSNNVIIRINRLHTVNGVDEKLLKKIHVPQMISIQQFCTSPASSTAPFHLTSFIEHCGNCSDGGHYVFYFHDSQTGEYFVISDENVQKIPQQIFLERASAAYLFLYHVNK